MKPVAIFRFSPGEGAGYLHTYLEAKKIPSQLFQLDQKIAVPNDLTQFSGFAFMGGPMSVNDQLPWIAEVEQLIRHAIADDKPCLGHCLGGQLIAKALGGVVTKNSVKEIGWNPVKVEDNASARAWLGNDLVEDRDLTVFQWHNETFTIPKDATRIITGDACANQAYVIGNTLGMQCHIEMTPKMIQSWCRDWHSEHVNPEEPSIQTPDEMMEEMRENLVALNQIADQLYGVWSAKLV